MGIIQRRVCTHNQDQRPPQDRLSQVLYEHHHGWDRRGVSHTCAVMLEKCTTYLCHTHMLKLIQKRIHYVLFKIPSLT